MLECIPRMGELLSIWGQIPAPLQGSAGGLGQHFLTSLVSSVIKKIIIILKSLKLLSISGAVPLETLPQPWHSGSQQ